MPSGCSPYDPQNDNSDNNGDQDQIEDTYADWQPDPQYIGDGPCNNLYDQDCGENCTRCDWTWPSGDPATWSSPDARCRCKSKVTLIWGDQCASATAGLCGAKCKDCRMATALNSSSGIAPECRCKAW